MADDRLLSRFEANGTLWMTPAAIGAMQGIDRRIKDGDESGWRGDPSMGLFYNQQLHRFEVWGFDAQNKEYLAAANDNLDVRIIEQLRNGDPRLHDVFQEVLDKNARLVADREAAEKEQRAAIADKLAWGIRQDFGQHLGGRKLMHAITDEHKVKEQV